MGRAQPRIKNERAQKSDCCDYGGSGSEQMRNKTIKFQARHVKNAKTPKFSSLLTIIIQSPLNAKLEFTNPTDVEIHFQKQPPSNHSNRTFGLFHSLS
jgi:hypothetical protein